MTAYVDFCFRLADRLVVVGWGTDAALVPPFGLVDAAGRPLSPAPPTVLRHPRADLVEAGRAAAGFVMIFATAPADRDGAAPAGLAAAAPATGRDPAPGRGPTIADRDPAIADRDPAAVDRGPTAADRDAAAAGRDAAAAGRDPAADRDPAAGATADPDGPPAGADPTAPAGAAAPAAAVGPPVALIAGAVALPAAYTADRLDDFVALAPDEAFLAVLFAIARGLLPPADGAAADSLHARARLRATPSATESPGFAAALDLVAADPAVAAVVVVGWALAAPGAAAVVPALLALSPAAVRPLETSFAAMARPDLAGYAGRYVVVERAGFAAAATLPPAAVAPGVMLLLAQAGRIAAVSRAADPVPFEALARRFAVLAPQLDAAPRARLRGALTASLGVAVAAGAPGAAAATVAAPGAAAPTAGAPGADAPAADAVPATAAAPTAPAAAAAAAPTALATAAVPAAPAAPAAGGGDPPLLVLDHDGRPRDLRVVLPLLGRAGIIEVVLAGTPADAALDNALAGARRDAPACPAVLHGDPAAAAAGRTIVFAASSLLIQHDDILGFLLDGAAGAARLAVWDPAGRPPAGDHPAAVVAEVARRGLPFALALGPAAAHRGLCAPALLTLPGRLLFALAAVPPGGLALHVAAGPYFLGEAAAASAARLPGGATALEFDLETIAGFGAGCPPRARADDGEGR